MFESVVIDALPAGGVLNLNSVAVVAGQNIDVSDINAGLLTYSPAADQNGTALNPIQFRVRDDGGTSNGGVDTDQNANFLTFDITPVNDAPDFNDLTILKNEDEVHTFSASDFVLLDTEGHNLLDVTRQRQLVVQ